MALQVTIDFNELPISIVVKHGKLSAKRNAQMVFTIGPRSILAEFPLSNSMEPLWGLKRANKPAPKTDKPLTKKAVKNLKRNKRRSDKRRAKFGAPKLAPFPALEMAKTALRKASQQRLSSVACRSMALPPSAIPAPRPRWVPTEKETLIRETSTNRAIIPSRQARVPSIVPRQTRVSTIAPRQVWIPTSTRKGVEPSRHPQTVTKPNKQFEKGTPGVKKDSKAQSTRRIFIGSVPIDIPIVEVMMTSYSEEVTTPKATKVKFVKPSTSSTPVMVPRTLQVKETTPPPVGVFMDRVPEPNKISVRVPEISGREEADPYPNRKLSGPDNLGSGYWVTNNPITTNLFFFCQIILWWDFLGSFC